MKICNGCSIAAGRRLTHKSQRAKVYLVSTGPLVTVAKDTDFCYNGRELQPQAA